MYMAGFESFENSFSLILKKKKGFVDKFCLTRALFFPGLFFYLQLNSKKIKHWPTD